jgi:hypothetical protein
MTLVSEDFGFIPISFSGDGGLPVPEIPQIVQESLINLGLSSDSVQAIWTISYGGQRELTTEELLPLIIQDNAAQFIPSYEDSGYAGQVSNLEYEAVTALLAQYLDGTSNFTFHLELESKNTFGFEAEDIAEAQAIREQLWEIYGGFPRDIEDISLEQLQTLLLEFINEFDLQLDIVEGLQTLWGSLTRAQKALLLALIALLTSQLLLSGLADEITRRIQEALENYQRMLSGSGSNILEWTEWRITPRAQNSRAGWNEVARRLGLTSRCVRAAVEAAKHALRLRGDDSVSVDQNGNIWFRGRNSRRDDIIGNVFDHCGDPHEDEVDFILPPNNDSDQSD